MKVTKSQIRILSIIHSILLFRSAVVFANMISAIPVEPLSFNSVLWNTLTIGLLFINMVILDNIIKGK